MGQSQLPKSTTTGKDATAHANRTPRIDYALRNNSSHKDTAAATLQQGSMLNAVARQLGVRSDPDLEQVILTQWHDLIRTGYFAWVLNLSNPNPPFFPCGRRELNPRAVKPYGFSHHFGFRRPPGVSVV